MAGAGNYGYGSNFGPWAAEESPEEQRRQQIADVLEKEGLSLPAQEKPEVMELIRWHGSERHRQTIVVIGVDASTETEFAFQRKCPSILYRCYKYNTPFYCWMFRAVLSTSVYPLYGTLESHSIRVRLPFINIAMTPRCFSGYPTYTWWTEKSEPRSIINRGINSKY